MSTTIAPPQINEITLGMALDLMKRAVTERGENFVYERTGGRCVYRKPDGTPDCLIGLMLSYIGPVPHPTAGPANETIAQMYPYTQRSVLEGLRDVQNKQDAGETWGTCLAFFEGWVAGCKR
jgi:hypothetical protein